MTTWGFVIKRVTRHGHMAERYSWRSVSDGNVVQPSWERTLGNLSRRFVMAGGATAHAQAFASAAAALDGGEGLPAASPAVHSPPSSPGDVQPDVSGAFAGAVPELAGHPLGGTNMYVSPGGEGMVPGTTLAIDWDPALLEDALDRAEIGATDDHPSVAAARREQDRPLSLAQCLDVFVRPEQLDDTRFCPKCSRVGDDIVMRPFGKQLEVWRAPPLLVVQLKRFQHTATMRQKLGNLVECPLNGLTLGDFMAREVVPQPAPDLSIWQALGGKLAEGGEAAPEAAAQSGADVPDSCGEAPDGGPTTGPGCIAAEQHFCGVPLSLTRNEGAVYDLYAVVNHLGALGAGHYIAHAKDASGTWQVFNDSHIAPLDVSEVVTPAAYLLFYARRDTAGKNIANLFPQVPGAVPVDIDHIRKAGQSSGFRCAIQ